jgi:hypothetical protein
MDSSAAPQSPVVCLCKGQVLGSRRKTPTNGVGMGLAWGWHGVGMGWAWGWHGVSMGRMGPHGDEPTGPLVAVAVAVAVGITATMGGGACWGRARFGGLKSVPSGLDQLL